MKQSGSSSRQDFESRQELPRDRREGDVSLEGLQHDSNTTALNNEMTIEHDLTNAICNMESIVSIYQQVTNMEVGIESQGSQQHHSATSLKHESEERQRRVRDVLQRALTISREGLDDEVQPQKNHRNVPPGAL